MVSLQDNKIITSTPNTIENNNNFLKDYINNQGFQFDTTCLEVVFRNLGDDFNKYVKNVGDYNTVAASNPIYTPPRTYQEKDYSGPCPDGWTDNGYWGGCTNQNYTGTCNAGRTKKTKRAATCPTTNSAGSKMNQSSYTYEVTKQRYEVRWGTRTNGWYWTWWPFDWEYRWEWYSYEVPVDYTENETSYYSYQNPNHYEGWFGPWDIGDYSYCYSQLDTDASNSAGSAYADCSNSGGSYGQPYCYKIYDYDYQTENPSWFNGYTDDNKRNWENGCNAYWPMKTINVPGKWTCTYGEKIDDDVGRGNIVQISSASSAFEAAKIALKSKKMVDNYFYILDNVVYIIGANSNVNVITSKGAYQPNCTEQNNRKGTLYLIDQSFFEMLNNCRIVNDKLNSVNTDRIILQNVSSNVIKENFESAEIVTNLNDIINNLKNNYNKKAELYNYQVDVVNNNDKIVENKNTRLNKQLDTMNQIQDQIALKSRVIELNDEVYNKQLFNKKLLIGFFILLPFLGIPLLLVSFNAVSTLFGLGIAGLIILGYVIYIIFIYKRNNIKRFIKPIIKKITKYEKAIQNYFKKVDNDCGCSPEEEEESQSGNQDNTNNNGNYLMKSNGPFYYYDGSAPPQQIYPEAMGSVEVAIEGKNYRFPKEVNEKLNNIKNPITKQFYIFWLTMLNQKGIHANDPRFSQKLDVIDFTDTDDTPLPFWENINLPIVSNLEQTFHHIIESYGKENQEIATDASTVLINIWNYIFGDKIPNDIYKEWISKFNKDNVSKFYDEYIQYLFMSKKFSDKYGAGSVQALFEIKRIEFIKTFNDKISFSDPVSKRIN